MARMWANLTVDIRAAIARTHLRETIFQVACCSTLVHTQSSIASSIPSKEMRNR